MASIICTVRPSRLPIYWSRKCIPLELKASCDLVEQEFETIFVQDHLPQLHLSIILGLPLDDDLKLDCGHIIGYHITFSWFLGIFVSHPICYHVGFYMFDFHLHFISDSWLRQFYHLIYTDLQTTVGGFYYLRVTTIFAYLYSILFGTICISYPLYAALPPVSLLPELVSQRKRDITLSTFVPQNIRDRHKNERSVAQ